MVNQCYTQFISNFNLNLVSRLEKNAWGNMKILIIDDEASLRETYGQVFTRKNKALENKLKSIEDDLFGDGSSNATFDRDQDFEITFASQGQEGVDLVKQAKDEGAPFQAAFIDYRMPPGIDGKETAKRIRKIDADINIAIVSGYTDQNISEIVSEVAPAHKVFFIAKPFDPKEVYQMAVALCQRWDFDANQVSLLKQKILEISESEARAVFTANHDFLTGAPNRMFFQREISERIKFDYAKTIVAFLDIDKFKSINDKFGHFTGDDIILTIFKQIKEIVGDDVFVARIGGDEFGFIFHNVETKIASQTLCKVLETINTPFSVLDISIHISASIGVFCPNSCEASDAKTIMRMADLALASVKANGGNAIACYDKALDESTKFKHMVLSSIESALEKGELANYYQPIVERNSLEVVGFEALLRWNSAEFGFISPGIFIPIVEESELIYLIGDWVLKQAILDSKAWPNHYVSVNFSPKQFKRPGFVEFLCKTADDAGVEYSKVQIEVTETAIFDNVENAQKMLKELHELGFKIALDDFGTGYSSLVSVKNFDLDCIKIDKSFVDKIGVERHSDAIVNSISNLAKSLGLTVVAEGVESETQCQALRLLGCSHLQGYLFGAAQNAKQTLERAIGEPNEIKPKAPNYPKLKTVA